MESWFSGGLHEWYKSNKRDLPWRNETDPYRIWLSEIILQQTQVAQGLSYYHRFITNYPTIRHLAKAPEDKILKDWQGLGYYSRARNLHHTAKFITEEYKGKFPSTYDQIRQLKGVGDYTAAAIASFAYKLPHAVVDGNVYRLLSRVFAIHAPIDSTAGKKVFSELASQLLDQDDPAAYNQAIMEFGSLYCRPVNPNCGDCIFKANCLAFKNKLVEKLPVKEKKTKVKARYFNYVVLIDKNKKIPINRRSGKDIWQGLYEFPLIETNEETTRNTFFKHPRFHELAGKKFTLHHQSKLYKHILSHQHLYARFYVIETNKQLTKLKSVTDLKGLQKLAFPRLIEKFLNDWKLNEIC